MERGYGHIIISTVNWRDCGVHEETHDKKWCGKLFPKDTYFDDIWFSGVKKSEEEDEEGLYYCCPVNIIHKGFLLATLEKLLKYCPIGSHLVMKSN